MRLAAIAPGESPRLTDRAAKPPTGAPDKDDLEERTTKLLDRLGELQARLFADARYALLVVLQGRDAAGKDGTVRRVFGACSPSGCQVTSFRQPTPLELSHDFLWRVHEKVPARGMIGIFNRSHYEDVLVVRVRGLAPKRVWSKRYDQINDFERLLAESSVRILKFFLHISRDEQREQLLERLTDASKNWKFRAGDLDDRELWDDYTAAYRDAIRRCSTPWAPWYVVPGDNRKFRDYAIARTVVEALESMHLEYPKATREVLQLARKLQ